MNFMRFFYRQNKSVIIIFFISLIIYLSYEFTMDWKEWFSGANNLFSLISQLSLAYMGGFIFYIIQTGYKDYKDYKARKVQLRILIPKIKKISAMMERHINVLFKRYLDIEYKQINNNKENFFELYKLMNLEDLLEDFDNNGNQKSIKLEQITHKNLILENIYNMYTFLGNEIEKDIQKLLNEILESDYFKSIEIIENNKLGNQTINSTTPISLNGTAVSKGIFKMMSINSEDLYSYYMFVKKLNEYVDKKKVELKL